MSGDEKLVKPDPAIFALAAERLGLPAHELLMVGDEGNVTQREHLAWAKAQLEAAGFAPRAGVVPGHPEAVIAREVGDRGIDLLVMGAYGHSRIRTMILGSTTTQVLRSCPIPVLLLR